MKSTMRYSAMVFLFLACGTPSGVQMDANNDGVSSPESNATIANAIDPTLFAKFDETSELLFRTDSIYFDNLTTQLDSALTTAEVKQLTTEFFGLNSLGHALLDVRTFYQIDSLKNIDAYENYVETIELGMMKESDAYSDRKIRIDDETTLLLWYINYSTYEACPWAMGTVLFATVLYKNELTSCTLVGESSRSADAPYWSSTDISGLFTNYGLYFEKLNRNGGDEDEEGKEMIEISIGQYALKIVDGKWALAQ